nr:hypothetical protein [Tanacetum cinerariifolium]
MAALLYKDDHNKVAYLENGKGWEAYEQILNFLNRSHIRFALTHRPTIVFDSLVKQFWATTTVRTQEAGPSDIIATIDGNAVVVTESLIRTQPQLDDVNGLYEFTLHDVLHGMRAIGFILDGMIGNIGSKRHKFLMYPRFLQMLLGIQTIDPSPRPTFDFTAKLFSIMKLNWDGPHMPLLAPMLVVPAIGDGADAVAAGAVAAENELGITKKVLGGAVPKLVIRVKRLEGLLQQQKRKLRLFDSEGQLAHSQLPIISSYLSSCVGDGGWTGYLYVYRCLISSHCLYFGAYAETWVGVQEQTALGKGKSNPLTVGSLLKTTWSSIHHLLTDEVLTSLEQTDTGKDVSNPLMAVTVCQKPLGYFSSPMIHVPRAELVFNPPG